MKIPKEVRYWCMLSVLLFLVYEADRLTSAEISVGPLYFFVVAYGAWYLGRLGGSIASIACVILWMVVDVRSGNRYTQDWIIWELVLTRFFTYLAETYFVTLYLATLEAHRRRLAMLEQVLAVCPGCGRIGPQEGGWRHAEELHLVNRDRYKFCPACTATQKTHAAANPPRSELA